MPDKARCCQNCKAPCAGDFKKVVDLQHSGLAIYIHTTKDELKKAGATKPSDTYILHNTGSKQINRPEYISELRQFKTKCVQCNSIVQRVRSLLDEIRTIKENEIIGLCNHCRRVNINKTCKRCDFIVSKFMSLHQKKCEEKQVRLKVWLSKVKHLLQAILEGENVCQHRVYKDSELERFLQQLKEPLSMRQLDIDLFPSLDPELLTSQQSLSEGKRMLEELLSNVKSEGKLSSDDSLYPAPSKTSCLCKYLKERQFQQRSGFGTEKSKFTKTSDLLSDQVTLGEKSKDSMFTKSSDLLSDQVKFGEKSKDFSKLSFDEIGNELIKRLLNLVKSLPKVMHLDEKLILELIQTIHTAIRQGLPKDMIKKLINELNELNKLLTPHFSDDINKDVIQKLINDLSKLITVESSKDTSQMLIQLLIHLSDLLASELVNTRATEQSQIIPRNAPKYIKGSQSREGRSSSPESQSLDIKQEFKDQRTDQKKRLPQTQSKIGTQGSTKDDTDKKQTLPKGKEVRSQEGEHITKSGNKETKPGLLKKDKNKGKLQAFSKDTINQDYKDKKPGSSTVTSKDIPKTTSQGANDLIQKIGNLNKALAGKSLNKDAIQDLSHDITKMLSQKSPDLNKAIIQDLTDLCEPVVQGIPKTANMKLVQNLIKDATSTLDKGISNEQNKKTAETALNELKKAINQSKRERKHLVDKKADNGKRKKESKYDFLDKSWSEGDIDEKETKTKKKGFKKAETIPDGSKEKENLLPSDKKRKIGKKSSTDLLSSKSIKPKEISGTVLLKMLQTNKERAARYQIFQERQRAKEKELERKRLKELALKGLQRPKKKEVTPPAVPIIASVIECNIEQTEVPQLMVSGGTIEPYKPYSKVEEDPVQPLIFKTKLEFSGDPMVERKSKHVMLFEDSFRDATIRYKLSDKEFITKGWTKLPTEKIMRKMNIYKMEPAKPNNDWFVRHKEEKELFYENGKKLADIDNDGRGRWYYQNGAIALDYYNAQESNIGQRYVVYSSGEEYESGKLKPRTVLALFDVLGNGVVYDHGGNVRLKFNQSEGIIVDPKLGPPGKWKWHTLNDPPVLQQVFVNTRLKERDPRLECVDITEKTTEKSNFVKASHPEMLAIEFDNFIKEKAAKLMQKFKPFQIRMKAIKLNKQFSLKILDQANIYLLFRDGVINLKLNLGLLLISDEIIDTDTADLSEVATPYDKYPAKTHSVENIQKILKSVRNGKVFHPIERDSKISI